MEAKSRGLILQHGDDGPAGILGDWLVERGIDHETHATWRDPLPDDPAAYASTGCNRKRLTAEAQAEPGRAASRARRRKSTSELVPAGPWLHYHYDQLEPPGGARTIAHSPAGPAAFTLSRSLGLQFHPESTPGIAAEWARLDPKLAPDEADRLAAQGAAAASEAEAAARKLFDAWYGMCTLSATLG
jgi:hypothetical protein